MIVQVALRCVAAWGLLSLLQAGPLRVDGFRVSRKRLADATYHSNNDADFHDTTKHTGEGSAEAFAQLVHRLSFSGSSRADPERQIAGDPYVDNGDDAYCQNIQDQSADIQPDKLWLFVQSGPHTGSTVLYESLASLSGASPLCRNELGYHAEMAERLKPSVTDFSTLDWKSYTPETNMIVPHTTNLNVIPERLKNSFLHLDRQVRILKAPATVFFGEALKEAFADRVRLLLLVREPYAYSEHLRETFFDSIKDDVVAYQTAAKMCGHIFDAQLNASMIPSTLVMKYEAFTSNPTQELAKLTQSVPELGAPIQAEIGIDKVKFMVHGKPSVIQNFNEKYTSKLTPSNRAVLTKQLLQYQQSISHFGYTLDA